MSQKDKKKLGVQNALVIFDRFKDNYVHLKQYYGYLRTLIIHIAIVLGNCSDRLQPLDISFNESVKEMLRAKFQSWYAHQIQCMSSRDLNFSKTILFVFKLPYFWNGTFLRETVKCIC